MSENRMKIERNLKIADLDDLLLIEINERVKSTIYRLKNDLDIDENDLKLLEIDKNSIDEVFREISSSRQMFAENLVNKIDYIIETQQKSDQ